MHHQTRAQQQFSSKGNQTPEFFFSAKQAHTRRAFLFTKQAQHTHQRNFLEAAER
jgi:hypothetical protein